MRHISTINPIAAFFAGPATRPRQAGRTGGAGATRTGRPIKRSPAKLDGRSAAGDQSYDPGTSVSVDSFRSLIATLSPPPTPPVATGESMARTVPPARAMHGGRV
jgi:hypothetical protein